MPNTLNMTFKYPLIAIFFFAIIQISSATIFVTVQDGPWGSPTTWTTYAGPGIPACSAPIAGPPTYVSSFFPTPVLGPSWFTRNVGDIIVVRHNVTMTHNILSGILPFW
jgi:hypothetical protein